MRKLSTGNKASFMMFTIIIIGIIAILVVFLNISRNFQKEEYTLESSTFLYDEENNPIELEKITTMRQKWNNKYYLNGKSQTEYCLGEQVVAYQTNSKTIGLYGNMYEISLDGTVYKTGDFLEITNTSVDKCYKLADRKYLIVGSKINNETGTVSTKNYLLITLDKAGNTLILNNELNAKTIKPIVLETNTFKFDVANEKLIYKDTQIDLKKVIGSTNEYKEVQKQEESNNIINAIEGEKNNNEDNSNNNNNNDNNSSNNGQNIGQNGGTTIENNGNTTNVDATINQDKNETETEAKPLPKSVNINDVTATSTYIDVNYYIVDSENKYQTVYLIVAGDINKMIALDKAKNIYRISGLTPNTDYKITLGTKELSEDNSLVDNIEDMINIRTEQLNSKISITKVAINKIYFNLKIDSNYILDTANVVLYVDGQKTKTIKANIDQAATSAGWNTSITYDYGNEVILRVEDAVYNGKKVNVDIETKFKNY